MRALLVLIAFLAACEPPPEAAPDDVDELMSFVFRHYELQDASQARSLADAAVNLMDWFESREWIPDDAEDPDAAFDEGFGALMSTLSDEALDSLDPPSVTADASKAVGVMVARHQDCDLADIDRVYLNPDQGTLFPENYDGYARSDSENIECFGDGTCDTANWRTHIDQTQLFWSYSMEMASGIRRIDAVPASDDNAAPVQARLARSWMLDEPQLSPDTARFVQNYQLEFMVPRGEGLVHFYGQWTHLEAEGINTEASAILNSYVDGLYEYLDQMQARCIID